MQRYLALWITLLGDEPSEDVGYRRDGRRRKYDLLTSKGPSSSREVLASNLRSMESIVNILCTHTHAHTHTGIPEF